MKQKLLHMFGLLAVGLMIGVSLAACSNSTSSPKSHQKIHVVSSVDFYGEAAKRVLGNKGTVTSVINKPSIDPHEYQPTSGVSKEVSQADVIIYNGIGYDTWMSKLAKINQSATVVRVGEDVMNKKTGDNPHLWYNTQTMPKLVKYLVKKFSKLQPKNKAYFQKNAQAYLKQLNQIATKVQALSKNSHQQLVDVSEPVFDYALSELGYRENNTDFAASVEKGIDPSPKDIRQMQADIKEHKIAFFVQNTQATDKTVASLVKLAKQYNVPVLSVTETMPKGKDFVQWMLGQYQQLSKIQQQSKSSTK